MSGDDVSCGNAEPVGEASRERRFGFEAIFHHSAVSMWVEDISSLRRAVRELKDSGVSDMTRYIDAHPEFITAAAEMIRVVDVNEATLRLFGVGTKEPLLGPLSRVRDTDDPSMREGVRDLVRLLSGGDSHHRNETIAITPDGRRLNGLTETYIPGDGDGFPYMVVSLVDVTEQRRMSQEIRDSRRSLADIIDFLPDPTFAIDAHGRVMAWNRALEGLTGVPASRMVGRGNYEHSLPFYKERRPMLADLVMRPDPAIEKRYSPVLIRDDGLLIAEMPFPDINGAAVHLWGKAVALSDAEGNVKGAIESVRDVTDRRKAERALRESEERYRSLVENLGEGIVILDRSLRFTFSNPAADRMFGFPTGGLVGRELASFLTEEGFLHLQTRARGRASAERSAYVQEIIRGDGQRRFVEFTASSHCSDDGAYDGSFAVLHDITAQRAAERTVRSLSEQLAQSQKMEAIGQLAGGVAHDFNNLLTTILGNAELLKDGREMPAENRELVEEIEKAGICAAALTSQLLSFSRKQMIQPRMVDPGALVENLAKMLRRLIPEGITLELDTGRPLSAVHVDPVRMEQVIINLAVNARDAMPDGGRLTIETRDAVLGEADLTGHAEGAPGPYVMIRVSDTGVGMDETVKSRLFEPFFTTKELGKGTGLGLSTVYGIVTQSGGLIRVDSAPGKGSSFRIFLPVMPPEGASCEVPTARHSAAGGAETVVVVDDDEALLTMTARILRSLGYTVRMHMLPSEALSRAAGGTEAGEDLLIADLDLPEMGGDELARRMRVHAPDLGVILMSRNAPPPDGGPSDGKLFLSKPFTRGDLARKVREILDRNRVG